MILAEATMKQLTERRDELQRQVDGINAEIARRGREWSQQQTREREEWARANPDRTSLLPLCGGAFDLFPNAGR